MVWYAQQRATVPKFGTWDSENVGYTVYFDKVREGKGAAPAQKMTNPNDNPGTIHAPPPPRPASSHSHGHGHAQDAHAPHRHPHQRAGAQHRRDGSDASSDPSEHGARGRGGGHHHEPSKFAPPQQYQPRLRNTAGHGGGAHHGMAAPRQQQVAPRASGSPQHAHHKASAVPKFGVWDEQDVAGGGGGMGFTMQFEKVKRQKEATRATVPDVPPVPSPERAPASRPHDSFLSKLCKCMFPTVKE